MEIFIFAYKEFYVSNILGIDVWKIDPWFLVGWIGEDWMNNQIGG